MPNLNHLIKVDPAILFHLVRSLPGNRPMRVKIFPPIPGSDFMDEVQCPYCFPNENGSVVFNFGRPHDIKICGSPGTMKAVFPNTDFYIDDSFFGDKTIAITVRETRLVEFCIDAKVAEELKHLSIDKLYSYMDPATKEEQEDPKATGVEIIKEENQ